MTSRSVLTWSLRMHRRSIIGWSIGMVVMSAYVMLLYPAVHGSASQIQQVIDQLPAAIRTAVLGEMAASDYAAPAGYVQSEMFSIMVPLLFLVFAIAHGSRAIAGNEERGELELVLATPVRRRAVVMGEFGALMATSAALALVLWVTLTLAALAVGASLDAWATLQATVSALLLALLYGALALAAGCLRGRRSTAIAVAAVLAVSAYLFNALSSSVDVLRPYRILSPFQWYLGGFLVRDGLEPGRVAALVVATAIVVTVSVVAFDRRDVGT